MLLRSFPPVSYRATSPFELIHSDLKSFPVPSYHKYTYIVTFLDDFTGHCWISHLRKKSDAFQATKDFFALVKNQHKTVVGTWMSDGGGEYKSLKFDQFLKGLGVRILQSDDQDFI